MWCANLYYFLSLIPRCVVVPELSTGVSVLLPLSVEPASLHHHTYLRG